MINSLSYALYRTEVLKQLKDLQTAREDVSQAFDILDAALEEALDKSSQVRGLDGTSSKRMKMMIKTMTMKLTDLNTIKDQMDHLKDLKNEV